MPAQPRPAATIVLVRQTPQGGLEFFLVKRSEGSSFMPGTHVFPGGRLDTADSSPELASRTDAPGSDGLSAFRIAAARELFEEAGILLARKRTGGPLGVDDDGFPARLRSYRKSLHAGSTTLSEILVAEDLILAVGGLPHIAHWITPAEEPKRFDTHFFAALCPEGQKAEPDGHEIIEGIWLTPREARSRNLAGTARLSPPTLKTLEDMAPFSSFESLPRYRDGAMLQPIVPVSIWLGGQFVVIFPWDREYERYRQGDLPAVIDHGRPSGDGDRTTRVVFHDGIALPHCRV